MRARLETLCFILDCAHTILLFCNTEIMLFRELPYHDVFLVLDSLFRGTRKINRQLLLLCVECCYKNNEC